MTVLDVGWIAKAHGLKGDVIVRLTTDRTSERTAPGAVFVVPGGELVVKTAKPYQKGFLVHFEGVDTKEDADRLRGTALQAHPLEDADAVFAHELIGKIVVDQHGNRYSKVVSLIDNPAANLLELADHQLIPMNFFVSIDAETIHVDVPVGLLDDQAVTVRDSDAPGAGSA